MNFTDSQYEKVMKETPQPEAPVTPGAPGGCRCVGCPYWRGIMCVSCYRELLKDFPPRR
ncbi:hypothetical protein [uncultured Oscillibacter sp.]|uniref:hypothetical protein n=1 Tax=uncultured Oscillibacter sp. TaxID=876091 RepID=UPI002609F755|nr:hypothetical protein [uncultured Oscillibacter sp.]